MAPRRRFRWAMGVCNSWPPEVVKLVQMRAHTASLRIRVAARESEMNKFVVGIVND